MAEEEQGFLVHLLELRQRLVRAATAVLLAFLALTPFIKDVFDFLSRPMMKALPAGSHLLATGVITPFMVPLKVTLFAAFVLASPYVLYQVWAFVAPGLYRNEKRFAMPVIISSVLMFFAGISYCYFVVFGVVFRFITGFAPDSVAVAPDIEQYLDFVMHMFLAFGLAFEVPVVVVLLVRTGIVGLARLRQLRSYIIVGATIIGAIFAPPDVLSQLLLAVPLWILFELGLLVAALFPPSPKEEKAS